MEIISQILTGLLVEEKIAPAGNIHFFQRRPSITMEFWWLFNFRPLEKTSRTQLKQIFFSVWNIYLVLATPMKNILLLLGSECCSQFSISFHRLQPQSILVSDHLLYRTSIYTRHVIGRVQDIFRHEVMTKTPMGLSTMKNAWLSADSFNTVWILWSFLEYFTDIEPTDNPDERNLRAINKQRFSESSRCLRKNL